MHAEISNPKSLKSKHKQWLRKQNKNTLSSFILQTGYRSSETLAIHKAQHKNYFSCHRGANSKILPTLQQSKIKILWGGKGTSMLPCSEQLRPPVFRCCLQIRFKSLVVIKEKGIFPETFSANAHPKDFWVHGQCKSTHALIQTRNGVLAAISTLFSSFTTLSLPDERTKRQFSNSMFQ